MTWSAQQYRKFEDERTRPAIELLARVPLTDVHHAIDLGCGPGNSTQLLVERYPQAAISGLDSSSDMLAAARQRLPGVTFLEGDIAQWTAQVAPDLIFANASLQWLPDHGSQLPRLLAQLAPGGCLAVQMPDNLDEDSHRLMREVAANGPWAEALREAAGAREARHAPKWYYRLLTQAGARVDLWRTTYYHPLAGGPGAIVEWLRATGLRPFLAPLDDAGQHAFLAAYQAELAEAYPTLDDGSVLLPFPRLFLVAQR